MTLQICSNMHRFQCRVRGVLACLSSPLRLRGHSHWPGFPSAGSPSRRQRETQESGEEERGRGVRFLPGVPAPGPARISAATARPAWALRGPGRCQTRCHRTAPCGLTESPGPGSRCFTSSVQTGPRRLADTEFPLVLLGSWV